ncbi:MAG: hypothetical protein MHPSP_001021 [Paramarteilia canceri]
MFERGLTVLKSSFLSRQRRSLMTRLVPLKDDKKMGFIQDVLHTSFFLIVSFAPGVYILYNYPKWKKMKEDSK